MKISEITRQVVTEHSAVRIRYRKQAHVPGQPIEYDVKDMFGGNNRGWVLLDATTANAMNTIYNALEKEETRSKWDTIPVQKLVDFTWKNIR